MTYVDAAEADQKRDGQIKLHGPEGFEGMRAAGGQMHRAASRLALRA